MEPIQEKEAKRLCICRLADTLKEFSELNPDAREKFMIARITQAIGWNAEMYVDMGFPKEDRDS